MYQLYILSHYRHTFYLQSVSEADCLIFLQVTELVLLVIGAKLDKLITIIY